MGGDPSGTTTPEELLAASHATCYTIALRSLIAQHGGKTRRIRMTATITAEKDQGIRILSSRLSGVVEGLEGIDGAALQAISSETEDRWVPGSPHQRSLPTAMTGPNRPPAARPLRGTSSLPSRAI